MPIEDLDEKALLEKIQALTIAVAQKRGTTAPIIPGIERVSLDPVFQYIEKVQRLPRESLVIKFGEEMREVKPHWGRWREASRLWLIEALCRNFQNSHYELNGGIPVSVQRNNERFYMQVPWTRRDDESMEDENLFYSDERVRLIATEENTFVEPKFTKYEVVRIAGEAGVGYRELVAKYRRLQGTGLLRTGANPENWAWNAFKSWPSEKIARITYR